MLLLLLLLDEEDHTLDEDDLVDHDLDDDDDDDDEEEEDPVFSAAASAGRYRLKKEQKGGSGTLTKKRAGEARVSASARGRTRRLNLDIYPGGPWGSLGAPLYPPLYLGSMGPRVQGPPNGSKGILWEGPRSPPRGPHGDPMGSNL